MGLKDYLVTKCSRFAAGELCLTDGFGLVRSLVRGLVALKHSGLGTAPVSPAER